MQDLILLTPIRLITDITGFFGALYLAIPYLVAGYVGGYLTSSYMYLKAGGK